MTDYNPKSKREEVERLFAEKGLPKQGYVSRGTTQRRQKSDVYIPRTTARTLAEASRTSVVPKYQYTIIPGGGIIHYAPSRYNPKPYDMMVYGNEDYVKMIATYDQPESTFDPVAVAQDAWGSDMADGTFWTNTQRVVRMKKQVDAGTQPYWVDPETVNSAYTYLSAKFAGQAPEQWTNLTEDDPAYSVLKGIPAPEHPSVYQIEEDYAKNNPLSPIVTGTWKNLGWAQKGMQLFGGAGTAPGISAKTSTASKWTSPLINAAMMGMAGTAFTGGNLVVGATAFATVYFTEVFRAYRTEQKVGELEYDPDSPPGMEKSLSGSIANFLYGFGNWDTMTDTQKRAAYEKVNANIRRGNLGDMGGYDQLMGVVGKIFGAASAGAEKAFGVVSMAVEDQSFATILEKSAWKAAELTYESGALGDIPLDIAGILSGKGFTKQGEVWQTGLGVSTPVKTEYDQNVDALVEMRDLINAGNDPETVLNSYREKFGVDGALNDFVYQTILDPLNFVPAAGAAGIRKVGVSVGDIQLAKAGHQASWGFSVGKKAKAMGLESSGWKGVARAVADIIPGGQLLLPAVTKGKIQPAGGIISSLNAYSAFLKTDSMGKLPKDYTPLQRVIAGITREGVLKQATPGGEDYSKLPKLMQGVAKLNDWVMRLTPQAKAMNDRYNMIDVLSRIAEDTNWDMDLFKKVFTQVANGNPDRYTDYADFLMNPDGTPMVDLDPNYYNSPVVITAQKSMKAFIDSGKFDLALDDMRKTAGNRQSLANFARAFGVDDNQIIKWGRNKNFDWEAKIKGIQDPERLAILSKMINPGENAGDFIKAQLNPFVRTKDPVPYRENMFGMRLMREFDKEMGDYLAKRFGVQEEKMIQRFAGVMKAAQSIVLLGFNPRYLINNEVNNIITRIATGVWGYNPDAIRVLDHYRVDYNRPDLQRTVLEMGDYVGQQIPEGLQKAKKPKSARWIEKGKHGFQWLNDKLGFASKASAKLERMESSQVLAVCLTDMMDTLWKPKLPDTLRNEIEAIHPGASADIEAIAKSSGAMDEMNEKLRGVDYIIPDGIVENIAKTYASQHTKARASADLYISLLKKTGLFDEISEQLKTVTNPTENDIKRVFGEIRKKRMGYLAEAMSNVIETHVADIRTRVSTGNPEDLHSIFMEMLLKNQLTKFDVQADWDAQFQLKDVVDKDTFEYNMKQTQDRQNARYEDQAKQDQATYTELLKGMDVDIDSTYAKEFLDSIDQTNKLYRQASDRKNEIFNQLVSKKYKDDEAYFKALEEAHAEVNKMYDETEVVANAVLQKANESLLTVLGNDPATKAWLDKSYQNTLEMQNLVKEFRAKLQTDKASASQAGVPMTSAEVNARWQAFYMEEYFPKYSENGYIRADGSQKVWLNKSRMVDYFSTQQKLNPRYSPFSDQMTIETIVKRIYGEDILKQPDFDMQRFINDVWTEARKNVGKIDARIPPNVVVQPFSQTEAAHEVLYRNILPMLDDLERGVLADLKKPRVKYSNMSPELQKKITDWANSLKSDLTGAKYASLKYAQIMRDFTMLNYQQKSNADSILDIVFPYQFWFTHTMRNWLLRSLDKSAWFNTYFRYREMQEKLGKYGLPTRLSDKMAAYAPYLPDFMGDMVFFDPMAQVFPFAQMFQPFENLVRKSTDVEHEAVSKLYAMKDEGTISAEELQQAVDSKSGALWEQAFQEAESESESDPMTLVSLMMSPALWINVAQKTLQGKTGEIAPTPMMKTSQSIATQMEISSGKRTAASTFVSIPSWLETNIRKAIGMSPAVAKYGQFGDYYIERELADMVFTGRATQEEAVNAMMTHSGAKYVEADMNVARQLSLKTPGMLTIEAIRGDANAAQLVSSFFVSFFPLGLLPQGELKYKNLQQENNLAWEIYEKTGDKRRVTQFFEDHPEMSARTALYEKDPTERLKQYVIGRIWDAYGGASKADQVIIKQALGEDFTDSFLNRETASEDVIDLETLLTWARQLNIMYPQEDQMQGVDLPDEPSVEVIDSFPEEVSAAYNAYTKTRSELFPFWYAEQQAYYAQPYGSRTASPKLQEYFEWKDNYIYDHPEIAPVIEAGKNPDVSKYKGITLKEFDPDLVSELSDYYTSGEPLSAGAWELLYVEWDSRGKPYNNFSTWLYKVIRPAITGTKSY